MKVVITGSSKGLGLTLAKKFLSYKDDVVLCSRNLNQDDNLISEINFNFEGKAYATNCDVAKFKDLQNLAEFAKEKMGSIDIWVNNAGTTGYDKSLLQNQDPNTIRQIINTNLTGTIYGCKVAINVMQNQGFGQIFNVDGLGSDGRVQNYYAVYGSTKRAIPYLTKSLVEETNDLPIGIHTISPGMVLTDLLIQNADTSSKRIFNYLAEKPDTVADFLVPKMREVEGTGQYIKFLTNLKVIWRFLTFWRRKNRFFDENGELIEDL